jgi:hypothetical protein
VQMGRLEGGVAGGMDGRERLEESAPAQAGAQGCTCRARVSGFLRAQENMRGRRLCFAPLANLIDILARSP